MYPHIREKYVLYFQDEMRYGLLSNVRRSWSKVGERAILPHQHAFENRYLFSAVNPLSGESFHLMGIDGMDSIAMNVFLTALKKQHPNEHVFVVVDNAPCHKPKWVRDVEGLTVIFLPPYSPELNPTERYFEEMRRGTANRVFETLEDIEGVIEAEVKRWSDDTKAMKQLLGYGWIVEQCAVVS
jgi:transposase